jgi:hypothetical protein
MKEQIIKFSNNIGKWHANFFMFLSKKAEQHPIWAWALTFWALYEIFEHITLPVMGILAAMGKLTIN